MPLPECPSCRAKMSGTEYGRYGAYICFYCDGTWLPGNAVEKLLFQFPNSPSLSQLVEASAGKMWATPTLCCPACATTRFRPFSKAGVEINLCSGCAGMFFPRGAFEMSFPDATKDNFPLGAVGGAVAAESVFWAALLFFAGLR